MIDKTFYSLGLGAMGAGVARELQTRGWRLVGATSHQIGEDAGTVTIDRTIGVSIAEDLPETLPETPAVCVIATKSTLPDVLPEIEWALSNGMNVLCSAEDLAFPDIETDPIAARIDALAQAAGLSVLGTGVNPGFVMDTLPILLSVACTRVNSVSIERVNDLSPFGDRVLESFGIGLSPGEYAEKEAAGLIAGHVGFEASIRMISQALSLEFDDIQYTSEPIIAREVREFRDKAVKPGEVAGASETATALNRGTPVISLSHPQQVVPQASGVSTNDRIRISGVPDIELTVSPEIPGGIGTIALLINSAANLVEARPGLVSMLDLGFPKLASDAVMVS